MAEATEKDNTGTNKNAEKNSLRRGRLGFILSKTALLTIVMAGLFAVGFYKKLGVETQISYIVMCMLGLGTVFFRFRRDSENGSVNEISARHPFKFLGFLTLGIMLSFACMFLPVECMPMAPVFLILSLYGNTAIGTIAGTTLLMMSVLFSGAGLPVFFMYIVSSLFTVGMICPIREDEKFGGRIFLSACCIFVCEIAGIILPANERPSFEMFIIPIVNIIISTILIIGIIRLYSRKVLYYYRDKYLELNDTENPMMKELRENNTPLYKQCIHTTHFIELISKEFGLDMDAMKCAGYYHNKKDELQALFEANDFPPAARRILEEYAEYKNGGGKVNIRTREVAAIIASETVITTILKVLSDEERKKSFDSDRIIDATFSHFDNTGTFNNCNISLAELLKMKKIFKDAKLYYDFLR
ncbi:MAG: hypothetical protein IJ608_08705 [Lachnospiraceae bacterium]|nr:hypothetical protein [Lachnospiraceae bacterium]